MTKSTTGAAEVVAAGGAVVACGAGAELSGCGRGAVDAAELSSLLSDAAASGSLLLQPAEPTSTPMTVNAVAA